MQALSFYDDGYLAVFDGTIDWDDAANIAAILLADGYTPSAAHSTYADVKANEISDADYAPQGVTTRATNLTSGEIRYTSDPVSFGSSVTISARYLALVVGDPAGLLDTDALIGYVDFGEIKPSTNSEYIYTPPAEGWFRIQKAA